MKVAEEVAKELLWRHLKERPGFDLIVKESVAAASQQDNMVKEISSEKQLELDMVENCKNDPNCSNNIIPVPREKTIGNHEAVEASKVNECLSSVKEPFIAKNIRSIYEAEGGTGLCAQLSLSSSSQLNDKLLFTCICEPSL